MDEEVKWSWAKFWIGKLSNKFIAWTLSTILIFLILYSDKIRLSSDIEFVIWIVWGVVTVIFMLAGSIDKAVENAKINIEMKASAGMEVKNGKP